MTSVIALRCFPRSPTFAIAGLKHDRTCDEVGLTQPHQTRKAIPHERHFSPDVVRSRVDDSESRDASFVSGAALIAVACVDEPAAPATAGRDMPNIADAGSGELLLSTGGSVWRSAAASDSTGDLLVARATIQGVSGDSIAVRLVSEDLVESPSPGPEPELLAVVEGRSIAITQAALRKGHRIFRFGDHGRVQVEYRLNAEGALFHVPKTSYWYKPPVVGSTVPRHHGYSVILVSRPSQPREVEGLVEPRAP